MRETTPQGDRILNWWQYQQGAALVDDSRPGNNITLKPYRRKWYQIYLKRSQKYASGNTSICDRLLDYKGTGLQSDLPSRHVLLQLIVRLTTLPPQCGQRDEFPTVESCATLSKQCHEGSRPGLRGPTERTRTLSRHGPRRRN